MIQLITTILFFLALGVAGVLSWVIIYHLKEFALPAASDHSKPMFYVFVFVLLALLGLSIFFFFRVPFEAVNLSDFF